MAPRSILKSLTIVVLHPNQDFEKAWTRDQLNRWITAAKGEYQTEVTQYTTHLVLSKSQWRQQGSEVQTALAFNHNRNTRKKIKIVTAAWLEESLHKQHKMKEKNYLWEKIDGKRARGNQRIDREEEEVVRGRDKPYAITDVFVESTEPYVTEKTKQQTQEEVEAVEEKQQELALQLQRRRDAAKAAFSEGVRKARNEFFTDDYHIYDDGTGFKYEIMLTKADMKTNTNQRIALTLYESNTEPFLYAVNSQFAATSRHPKNTILAATGCPFPTAFRTFKNGFKHLTHIDWDERIPAADASKKATQHIDPENRPFMYFPPCIGPRGRLPEGAYEPLDAAVEDVNVQALLAEQDRMRAYSGSAHPMTVAKPVEDPFDNVGVVDNLNVASTPSNFRAFPNVAWDSAGSVDATQDAQEEQIDYNHDEMNWLLDTAGPANDQSFGSMASWAGTNDQETIDDKGMNGDQVASAGAESDRMDIISPHSHASQEEAAETTVQDDGRDDVSPSIAVNDTMDTKLQQDGAPYEGMGDSRVEASNDSEVHPLPVEIEGLAFEQLQSETPHNGHIENRADNVDEHSESGPDDYNGIQPSQSGFPVDTNTVSNVAEDQHDDLMFDGTELQQNAMVVYDMPNPYETYASMAHMADANMEF